MQLNEIMYAAVGPAGQVLGDGEAGIISFDEETAAKEGAYFAAFNGLKKDEVRVIKVKLVEANEPESLATTDKK